MARELVHLTGRMRVVGRGGTVDGSRLAGRQGRLVLASLGTAERPVHRDTLAERLWHGTPPGSWQRDVSALVSRLRSALDGARVEDVAIESDGTSYELTGPRVDVRVARTAAGLLAREQEPDTALEHSRAVLATTSQPFLDGEDDLWVLAVREELARLHDDALDHAAAAHQHRGDLDAARRDLETLVARAPLREPAHRRLMAVQLALGNRAEAVATYQRLRSTLADRYGIDPSPATERLFVAALRDQSPHVPAATPLHAAAAPAVDPPTVRYARNGEISIAYQVIGDGPVDVLWVPGWVSNLEVQWEEERFAGFLRALGERCRLVTFDKRGTGLSDPVPIDEPPDLPTRIADVRAVMDHSGTESAVLLGFSGGGPMAIELAVSEPDRVRGLVLYGTWARPLRGDGHPYGWTVEEGRRRFVQPMRQGGVPAARWFAPSLAGDEVFERWFRRYARQSASPGMALTLLRANEQMDVRDRLGDVAVPTLVLHRRDDSLVELGQGRLLAERISGARFVELGGGDHWPWIGDSDEVLEAITGFLPTTGRGTGSA